MRDLVAVTLAAGGITATMTACAVIISQRHRLAHMRVGRLLEISFHRARSNATKTR